jgi:hypothetical protein
VVLNEKNFYSFLFVSFEYGPNKIAGNALDLVTLPGNTSRVPQNDDGTPAKEAVKNIPGAYFYRMIGPFYKLSDPFNGNYANSWKYPWPNNDTTTPWNIFGLIHWNDWKPITGENVWSAIIGPIQVINYFISLFLLIFFLTKIN